MEKGKNPFLLIARIGLKEDVAEGGFLVDEYLEIAQEVDEAVYESEPGMLLHNFDMHPDGANSGKFVWSEVYLNSEALIAHINNPPVQAYVEKHAELADTFEIEVYGNLSGDAIDAVEGLGVPFKHFRTSAVGFIREDFWESEIS
tara:strand:- start:1842 stop:2276 length:435 start_codon:yes stop_codon:yes gene_type:complete